MGKYSEEYYHLDCFFLVSLDSERRRDFALVPKHHLSVRPGRVVVDDALFFVPSRYTHPDSNAGHFQRVRQPHHESAEMGELYSYFAFLRR